MKAYEYDQIQPLLYKAESIILCVNSLQDASPIETNGALWAAQDLIGAALERLKTLSEQDDDAS